MSDPPRNDQQDIHVHVDDEGAGRNAGPRDPHGKEEAAMASAMSAQLIWIILVVILVVAVVLLFTTGVIDFGGADNVVDDVVQTPTS